MGVTPRLLPQKFRGLNCKQPLLLRGVARIPTKLCVLSSTSFAATALTEKSLWLRQLARPPFAWLQFH